MIWKTIANNRNKCKGTSSGKYIKTSNDNADTVYETVRISQNNNSHLKLKLQGTKNDFIPRK